MFLLNITQIKHALFKQATIFQTCGFRPIPFYLYFTIGEMTVSKNKNEFIRIRILDKAKPFLKILLLLELINK
jgi:hypothetical protein